MDGDWESPPCKHVRATVRSSSRTSSGTSSKPKSTIAKIPVGVGFARSSYSTPKKKTAAGLHTAEENSDCRGIAINVGSRPVRHGALRVASDCSGWCSELWALAGMNIKVEHIFTSEIEPAARRLMKKLWGVHTIFPDLTKRDHTAIHAKIDLYVAGIPCQPFSRQGLHLGIQDNRGSIFFHVLAFLTSNKPEAFVIENVASLVTDHAETFRAMVAVLNDIEDGHAKTYTVSWKILHTNEHGLPQHRERVFIIGIKTTSMVKPFTWPTTTEMRSLTSILDLAPNLPLADEHKFSVTKLKNLLAITERYKNNANMLLKDENVCNIGGSSPHIMVNMCPCLTKSRASQRGYYSFSRQRSLTIEDMCRLQGVPAKDIKGWGSVVTDAQIGGIIGNAIPVCVMERVLHAILSSLGHCPGPDRWQSADTVPLA